MSEPVYLVPDEGWDRIDGQLAPRFEVGILAEGVEFAKGVVGWKAKAIDGKYAKAQVRITPRHSPWSGWVALSINDAKDGRLLFSGLAKSERLAPSWRS